MTTTFADYLLISTAEMPPVDILHLESPSTMNALGVKGVGESGVIPVAGAIMSAVDDALSDLGVHIDRAPISPQVLFKYIIDARGNPGERQAKDERRRAAMKPAPFLLHRPATVEDAVRLLAGVADEGGLVLAGGQSLVPMMALRVVYPPALIDINAIAGFGSRPCRWCAPFDWRYGAPRLLPSSVKEHE